MRVGFLLLVLAFGAYWVIKNRHSFADAAQRITFWPIAGALVAGALGAWSGVPAWRSVLAGLGSPLPLKDAQRVFLTGQLGKYIPGGVWTVVAQARLAKDLDVPTTRSATASLMSILLSVVTAASMGALCLGIAGRQILGDYGWTLWLVLPLVALLHPAVLVWAGRVVSRITRRNVPLQRIPARNLVIAAAWSIGGQVVNGLQFFLLVGMVGGTYPNPLLAIGLFSTATAVGIVVIFASAGAGPRELLLAAGLNPLMPPGSAALVVLLSRAVLTVVDLVLAGIALRAGRRTTTSR
ncbi:hypothetical protein ABIB25_003712 [Nakamurella sp. UYEF19]|uniref:lysylphosphatidylglycerol synthase domain-containing protein n=1 Tax=Nakamurella sp. UYEF19 TaxID=1756392 RepID=UPI003393682E